MANDNLGSMIVRVGLDGTDFDKGVKNLNAKMKLAQSELKASSSSFENFGKTVDGLKIKYDNLSKQYQLQGERVKQLRKQYDDLVKSGQGQSQAALKVAKSLNYEIASYNRLGKEVENVSSELRELTIETKYQESSWAKAEKSLASFSDRASKTGTTLQSLGKGLTVGVSLPLATLGGLAMKSASDFQKSQGKMQAALNLTKEEAKAMGETAKEVWKDGFGNDMNEVSEGVISVKKNLQNITGKELESVSRQAFILRDTFGYEIPESTRAAKALVDQFGVDASKAMDYITVAAQKGGDYSNELLDTISEYSVQFKTAGMDIDGMFNVLIQGAQNGAWNLDKVGDAVKEYAIRAVDGSKTTEEGFKLIGLNADDMAKKMAQGGDSAQKAFMATVAAITSMKDPLKQQQAGVALFGTQWEDLQKNVIGAMDPTKDVLGEVAGATNKAGKALKDNLGDRATQHLRELGAALIPLGNILLDTIEPAFESASEHIKAFTEWMESLSPTGKKTVVAIAAITAALGPVAIGLGFVVKGVGAVSKVLSTGIGVFGKYRTSAMLTTTSVSNLGNSATIAGGKLKGTNTAIGNTSSKLVGMGGTVLSTTKNIGNLSKILGVARLGVGALGGPVGILATVGLPLLVQGGAKLYKHLKEESIPTIENFGDKVSESTSKAVLGYKKLNDDATTQLNELMWSGEEITAETAEKLTSTFGKMGDKISESLKLDFEESYKNLSTFLSNSKSLSETEQQEILNNMKIKQEEQQKAVQDSENRIKEIMQLASQEKRTLTQAEKDEINMIQNQMMTTAVQTMSKSEVEQKAIMEKLKNESANITAQQAATTVQNSLKAKNGAVKEANDKYNKTVAAIIRERDETGTISAQQAQKMIKEAQLQRDKSVSAATEMHNRVVEQAKSQAGGQVDQIDWTSGEVLSNWDLMVRGTAKTINAISSGINWVLDKIGVKTKIPMWEPKGYSSKKNSGPSSGRRATGNMELYAKGTPSSGHPGGPAIVGEKGRELAHIPGQGITLLGTRGAEYHSNLPKGTSVLPNKPTERLLKSYGFPGYEDGVGNFFDWALKGPKTLMDNVWKKFGVSIETPGGALETLGTGILNFLNNKTLAFFKSKIDDFFSFGGSAASGNVKSWIAQAMAITGVPATWASSLMTIAMKESGGNPKAYNDWDINAKRGIASRGLMQTIPPTFEAYKMPGLNDIFNPVHNAVAAIRYIQARYGNVFNVPGIKSMASGGAYKGYATGGEINHPQLAMLGENRWKEWVITSEPRYRRNNLSMWAEAGQAMGVPFIPNVPSIPSGNYSSSSGLMSQFNALFETIENFFEKPIALTVNLTSTMDARELSRGTWKYDVEYQERDNKVKKTFRGE